MNVYEDSEERAISFYILTRHPHLTLIIETFRETSADAIEKKVLLHAASLSFFSWDLSRNIAYYDFKP